MSVIGLVQSRYREAYFDQITHEVVNFNGKPILQIQQAS